MNAPWSNVTSWKVYEKRFNSTMDAFIERDYIKAEIWLEGLYKIIELEPLLEAQLDCVLSEIIENI